MAGMKRGSRRRAGRGSSSRKRGSRKSGGNRRMGSSNVMRTSAAGGAASGGQVLATGGPEQQRGFGALNNAALKKRQRAGRRRPEGEAKTKTAEEEDGPLALHERMLRFKKRHIQLLWLAEALLYVGFLWAFHSLLFTTRSVGRTHMTRA